MGPGPHQRGAQHREERHTDELRENWAEDRRWEPTWDEETRSGGYQQWRKAVQRTLDRVDVDD